MKACEAVLDGQSSLLEQWGSMSSGCANFSVLKTFLLTKIEENKGVMPYGKHDHDPDWLGWHIGGHCGPGLCEFYLFPINYPNSHWSLGIVWQTNEDQLPQQNVILYLDSLPTYIAAGTVEKKGEAIRAYLNSLTSKKFTKRNLPIICVKVPKQENDYDCGMFLLHYAILFIMSESKSELASDLLEGKKENWFTKEVPCNLRSPLREAVHHQIKLLLKDDEPRLNGTSLSELQKAQLHEEKATEIPHDLASTDSEDITQREESLEINSKKTRRGKKIKGGKKDKQEGRKKPL